MKLIIIKLLIKYKKLIQEIDHQTSKVLRAAERKRSESYCNHISKIGVIINKLITKQNIKKYNLKGE